MFIGSLARLATWLFPVDSDHWIFYYVGKHWFDGGALYLTAWDHKAPLIFAFNGLMSDALGNNLVLHRIFLTVLSVSSVFLFYITTKALFRHIESRSVEINARVATLVFAFWSNLSQFTNSGNTTESYGVIFLLLAVYFYHRYREKLHWKWLLYSGVAVSLLIYLKINFAILLLPLIIDFIRLNYKNHRIFIFSGFIWVIPTIIQTVYWYWYFSTLGLLPDAVVAGLTFNSKYLRAGWAGNLSGQLLFIAILAIAGLFFVSFVKAGLGIRNYKSKSYLIFLITATSLLFSIILGTFYNHYYLIVIPYLSMLAGLYWRKIINSKLVLIACFIGLVGSYGVSTKQLYNSFFGSVRLEYSQMKNAAEYVKSNSSKDDKIIYHGYGATFYHLSDRDSGSRFISASHPLIDERENFGYNLTGKHIGDMAMNKPKYVVVNLSTKDLYNQNSRVKKYFENHYKLEKTLPGYEILVLTD